MNNKNLTFPNNITFAKKTFWNILYISAIFSIGSLSAAETVILKNGTVFKGQVLDQNKEGVKVKTEDGRSIEISKFQILKIIYREVSSEQMKSIKAAEEKRLKDLERLAQEKEKAGEAKRHEIESEIAKAEEEKNKQEEEERIAFLKSKGIDTGPKTRFGAILRSVILPGWGQFYQGRNVAGVGFFGTFLAGAGYAAYQQQEYLARVNDYHYANEKFNYNYFFQKTINLVDQHWIMHGTDRKSPSQFLQEFMPSI
ncbi:MAG: hypothetical protein K8R21_02410 [Leptospira sp.]|nr:hypothetical protein [Leptospira sp.]